MALPAAGSQAEHNTESCTPSPLKTTATGNSPNWDATSRLARLLAPALWLRNSGRSSYTSTPNAFASSPRGSATAPRTAAALKIWLASLSRERQGSFVELAAFEAAALILPASVDSAHWYSGWKILQDYPGSTPDSLRTQASELDYLHAQAVLRRSKGAQSGEQAPEGEAPVTAKMPGRRGSRSASRPVTTLAAS
ncbi:hypothetical protein [Streptomyces uncialis]|uniref:hypothetical protein n=1 Tax=Streptomyces uncialis TaxID=1048205 RepID=UPI00378EDE0E